MNRQLAYAVVADGGTDRLLVPIIEWAIHRLDPDVEILEPEFRKRRGSLREFLIHYSTDAMLIFAHRDSESLTLDERLQEFTSLDRSDVVPVVPVRMSESWILFDSSAISTAAGSASSQVEVPKTSEIESIQDPKDLLDSLLFQAAGSPTGRRGRLFKRSIIQRRVNVASYISDYSPLEDLDAFRKFQESLTHNYPYKHQLSS